MPSGSAVRGYTRLIWAAPYDTKTEHETLRAGSAVTTWSELNRTSSPT